jgi:hypothetical protein
MRDWLDSLESRERLFVLGGAAAVALALLYAFVWTPLDNGRLRSCDRSGAYKQRRPAAAGRPRAAIRLRLSSSIRHYAYGDWIVPCDAASQLQATAFALSLRMLLLTTWCSGSMTSVLNMRCR